MTPDHTDSPPRRSAHRYLRALTRARSGGGLLESTGLGGGDAATRNATELGAPAVRQLHLDRLARAFTKADRGEIPPGADLARERDTVMRHADAAMTKLARDKAGAALDRNDVVGLEAVIRLTGRPSILIKDGDLDLDPADPDLAEWLGTILLARSGMQDTIRSVGRIDRAGIHIGTGFVVAPGLVMTNRHVLQEIARETPAGGGSWTLLGGTTTIDFAMEYGSSQTSQCTITGVAYSGPAPIGDTIDVAKLDLALLTVDGDPPPPLSLSANLASGRRTSEVYMVGYPARPAALPSGTGPEDLELIDTLKRVFRMRYGFKRLALGAITLPLGQVPNDAEAWAIGHDATTLGGNSGSCVVGLDDEGPVLGLHFGGIFFDHNLAHMCAAVPSLRDAPCAGLGMTWR